MFSFDSTVVESDAVLCFAPVSLVMSLSIAVGFLSSTIALGRHSLMAMRLRRLRDVLAFFAVPEVIAKGEESVDSVFGLVLTLQSRVGSPINTFSFETASKNISEEGTTLARTRGGEDNLFKKSLVANATGSSNLVYLDMCG